LGRRFLPSDFRLYDYLADKAHEAPYWNNMTFLKKKKLIPCL